MLAESFRKWKNIIAHDRFLVKLQCFASDAMGPLVVLLRDLQAGKAVVKDKAVTALQTVTVLHRKYICNHLG